jgi:hypothetical protein
MAGVLIMSHKLSAASASQSIKMLFAVPAQQYPHDKIPENE